MKEQVIYLEPHDDVISARDKLRWIRAERALLVFPSESSQPILRDRLDLVLLRREAARRNADLALISRDPVILEQCAEAGISCFVSVEASRRLSRTPPTRLAEKGANLPPSPGLDAPDAAISGNEFVAFARGSLSNAVRHAGVAAAVAALIGAVALLVPSATIQLRPNNRQASVIAHVVADPTAATIDLTQGIIPSRVLEKTVTASVSVNATGSVRSPTRKAHGSVIITNLAADQVLIRSGAIVTTATSSPISFVTLQDVTLPGRVGQSVTVEIEAVEPGIEGNVPGGAITLLESPLGDRAQVSNPAPTDGGEAQVVQAISQQDYDHARALIAQQLYQRAYTEMLTDEVAALLDTEFVPPESLLIARVIYATYSGVVDQPAEALTLSMEAIIQAQAIDERGARQVAYSQLIHEIGTGTPINPDSLLFERGPVESIDQHRRVVFTIRGWGESLAGIQPAEIPALAAGLPAHDAARLLQERLSLAEPPHVEIWPSFWPAMPLIPSRIQIVVEKDN